MIHNAWMNKPLPVYGDGLQIRDWLHVLDHCAAIYTVLTKGKIGEIYNIGGNNEKANSGDCASDPQGIGQAGEPHYLCEGPSRS